ncbi:MAG: DUF4403 family protein [Saprospiraceae bacterium]|nr:DUF4403 family protein [Saprospiraceae bacterium]MBK8484865.1 DUF4403 family protein [Saprospiraceae bacterium]MBK9223308.1 DUF4403 family protein [Saprospiraceae bacterium]MBK9720836.1 DUF4403 family protein [Saprospiraceae bacterium]MBK9727832.1 DUF4403 family protein [Saprospiraceae bacterium]
MNTRVLLCVALTVLMNFQCSKKMHPTESSEIMNVAPLLPSSNLNLTLKVSRVELNAVINTIVTTSFAEGFTIDEGYKIQTRIFGPVDMQTLNNAILTSIPLQVEITPSGMFSQLKVKGQIEIQLSTSLDIFQDKLLNKTELVAHNWISKPVLNVMGLNIPIELIANRIIKKYKSIICENIDQAIQSNIDLNKIKRSTLSFFEKPLYSTDDGIIHVFASPLEYALGPMSMSANELIIPVMLYFESVISELRPDDLKNDPSFSIRPFFNPKSSFNIQSRIPIPYLEQLVRENVENQTFGSGISKVTVGKISMRGEAKTLQVQMALSGAFNGKMELYFDPVYDKNSKKIDLLNLKLKTIQGPKMEKIIFSLIKGIAENKLKNTIEDQINANLTDYVSNILHMLSGTEILEGVFLDGQLIEYEIKDIRFYNYRMYFTISSSVNMQAQVKKINTGKLILNKF